MPDDADIFDATPDPTGAPASGDLGDDLTPTHTPAAPPTGHGAIDAARADTSDPETDPATGKPAPRYGHLTFAKKQFGIWRTPTALHHVQIAAADRRKDGGLFMVAMEQVLRHCMQDDYTAFEEHFNASVENVDAERQFELIGGVLDHIMGATGRPKK